ncbi:hypothetical protein EB73_29035 [Mycobacterium sp. SWH-M3]|nr:hypothetical protein EB73_29035 [Mycobacterium sp. SWH-M3]
MRQLIIIATAAIFVAGCGASQPATATWPGKFFSNPRKIDFYDQTYQISDVKILCSESNNGLTIRIAAPDGTEVTSTRPEDGSRKADIQVSGGGREPQTLTNGAVWNNVNGEWGFEGDPDDTDSHSVFYLHDGAAICPPE